MPREGSAGVRDGGVEVLTCAVRIRDGYVGFRKGGGGVLGVVVEVWDGSVTLLACGF